MLGQRLRELRTKKKLTMKELGKIFGVAESTISGYENDVRKPDIEMIIKFADFFDVTVDYLVGRNPDDEPPLNDGDEKAMQMFIKDIEKLPLEGLLRKYALEYHDIDFSDDEARLAIEIIKANRRINKK